VRMNQSAGNEVESLRRRLAVQTATTRVLAEKNSLADAVPALLAEIGTELRWAVGEFWEPAPDGEVLQRTAAWHSGDTNAQAFVAGCEGFTFHRGIRLPGLVWESRQPEVITDVVQANDLPRGPLARECGLESALAFPVQIHDEFFGVLEFFSDRPECSDPELLATMGAVGNQLGQFVRRTRAEAARLESESRFRVFAETASDATFTINEASTIIYVNPSVERIFGYKPAELLGKSLVTIIPARMREKHHAGIRRYRETGKRNIPWSGVELPGLHKDGHEVPLEISFGEYSRDGVRYFTGIARDITERVRFQRESEEYADRLTRLVGELEARSDEAEAASRAKSQFLANMSHELRTPINAIVGYNELLQMGLAGPLTKEQAEYLERVSVSAKHLLGLVTDVLDLSKIEAGHFTVTTEVVPIADDILAAMALVRPQAEAKSVALTHECSIDTKYLGDSGRVRQILVNLLSNAVKFTDPGGSVTVRCAGDDHRPHGDNAKGPQSWLHVSVEDTGIGIAADQLSAIFQHFVQASTGTTRTHGGTGLGLSISLQLARLMNAEITAESEPGKGSTFTLWLRRALQ
jgi:two-component system sensor histidine kinase/response regulator